MRAFNRHKKEDVRELFDVFQQTVVSYIMYQELMMAKQQKHSKWSERTWVNSLESDYATTCCLVTVMNTTGNVIRDKTSAVGRHYVLKKS